MAINPHEGQTTLHAGAPLDDAAAALIMLHGRGADARDMLGLASQLQARIDPTQTPRLAAHADKIAYLAPNAAGNAWYPYRFIEPVKRNEPFLSGALEIVGGLIAHVRASGMALDKIMLLGFSQGACLALEYAARHPQRYGAVFGLSGGLIGETLPTYSGALSDTPVLIGCSDVDFHIPVQRVRESANVFRALGAAVDERIYPQMGHTINDDEVTAILARMNEVLA